MKLKTPTLPSVPTKKDVKRWVLRQIQLVILVGLGAGWFLYFYRDLTPLQEGILWSATLSIPFTHFILGPWVESMLAPEHTKYLQVVDAGTNFLKEDEENESDQRAWNAPIEIGPETWADLTVVRGQLEPMDAPEEWGEVYEVLEYDEETNEVVTTYEDEPDPRELRAAKAKVDRVYNELLETKKDLESLKDLYPDAVLAGVEDVNKTTREGLIQGAFPGDSGDRLADRIEKSIGEMVGLENGEDDGKTKEDERTTEEIRREQVRELLETGDMNQVTNGHE